MSFLDENLLTEFVAESRDHLSHIEPVLLELEKSADAIEQEAINRIFRAIHSIKGAASFFGFETLKRLSHVMESLLMLIRDGKMRPTPEIVDGLLGGVDKLNLLINDLHNSDTIDCEAEIQVLEAHLAAKDGTSVGATASKAESATPTTGDALVSPNDLPAGLQPFQTPLETIETHRMQGAHLFRMDLDKRSKKAQEELFTLLRSMGSLIEEAKTDKKAVCLLYASVLEADILQGAVPDGVAIQTLDLPKNDAFHQKANALKQANNAAKTDPAAPAVVVKSGDNTTVARNEKNTPETTDTVRVRVDLLNKLMNLAGEMVLVRNQLSRAVKNDEHQLDNLSGIMQNLDLATSELQEHIMQTRMQPIGNIFGKFPRIIRDLSKKLDKQIELEISGEDVELDKSLIEALSDPLNHLIRNCCDHGIEMPQERLNVNKSANGTIILKAFHEGGQINISITDDGRGIDADKISAKAVKAGLISQSELDAMSQRDIANLIFLPGLSTAEKVSDISGRGVGMDVVKTNIEKMGGHISLESEPGMGTSILLRLPLTLAIIPSLIVNVQDYRFAISQANLVELICIKATEINQRIERVGTASVLRLRGKLLPLIRLADVLGIERQYTDPENIQQQPDRRQNIEDERQFVAPQTADVTSTRERRNHPASDYFVVVLQVGNHQYGLIVDNVLDLEEIVVKPLSSYLKTCQSFNGATIMGDGRVALILDASGILNAAKLSFGDLHNQALTNAEAQHTDEARQKQSVLLFSNAENEVFAIPLSSVLRLEKFQADGIESIGNKEFITYRERGLPIIRLERHLPVKPCPPDVRDLFMIIPKVGEDDEKAVAGIVATHIIDAIETELNLENSIIRQPGVQGTTIINGRMVLVIDAEAITEAADLIQKREIAHV